jgi:hypothetical protein
MHDLANVTTPRKRLPNRRESETIIFDHDGRRHSATFSRFPDGSLGEVFLGVGKTGSDTQTLADVSAILASRLLQCGIPAHEVADAVASSAVARAIRIAEARA